MWLIGLACGTRWAQGDLPVENWAKRFIAPALVIAPVLFALRYSVGHGIELGRFEVSFDKWHLGAVRLIDFAAIAALLVHFQALVKPLAIRPLVLMGQASLQVFCAHLLFCFFGLALMGDAPMVNGWQQAALVTITLSGMFLTALFFSRKLPVAATAKPSARPLPQFGD
jgi:hypothetical protein